MREEARSVPIQTQGEGLVVAQWYVDAFYDAVEDLPSPSDDPKGFAAASEEIEEWTETTVNAALERLREELYSRGVRLVVAER